MSLNEFTVEAAALEWFGELGYGVAFGPDLAPGERKAERDSFGEVVLVGRLRDAVRRLNPAIPEEAREDAVRKVLRVATPSLVGTNRRFHRVRTAALRPHGSADVFARSRAQGPNVARGDPDGPWGSHCG